MFPYCQLREKAIMLETDTYVLSNLWHFRANILARDCSVARRWSSGTYIVSEKDKSEVSDFDSERRSTVHQIDLPVNMLMVVVFPAPNVTKTQRVIKYTTRHEGEICTSTFETGASKALMFATYRCDRGEP